METWVVVLPLGLGMFFLGWFAHAWFSRPSEALLPDEGESELVAGLPGTRWLCPTCGKRRSLPTELDSKVLLCNNCQVRLVRADGHRPD